MTIKPDGTVDLATQDLVTLLGGEVVSQELTGDAYVDVEADEQVRRWR